MFVTNGPVFPESPLFVGRQSELAVMRRWLAATECVGVVLGARQTGKTSLLLKLRETVQGLHKVVFVNLESIHGATIDECFAFVSSELLLQLGEAAANVVPFGDRRNTTFLSFLQDLSSQISTVRIALILDEFGALPASTAVKVAHTIRSAFTDRVLKPELRRYCFVVAGAAEMLELTRSRNSPLWNVTDTIYLEDLTFQEVQQLLAHFVPDLEAQNRIYDWSGGHPYWTQRLAAECEREAVQPTEKILSSLVDSLLQTEDRNLPHVTQAIESDDGRMRTVLEKILDGHAVRFTRSDRAIAQLELIGVLKNVDGRGVIRNALYREALCNWLGYRALPPVEPIRDHDVSPYRLVDPREIDSSTRKRVFVSYNHNDSVVAAQIKTYLQQHGFEIIFDTDTMTPGQPIVQFIDRSVADAEAVISVVSSQSLLSAWVALETIACFEREKWERRKLFIACTLTDDFFLPEFRLNCTGRIDDRINEIERLLPKYAEQRIDSVDLNEEKTRLYDLRNNLGRVLVRLKGSLCLDIREPAFDRSLKQLVTTLGGD